MCECIFQSCTCCCSICIQALQPKFLGAAEATSIANPVLSEETGSEKEYKKMTLLLERVNCVEGLI